MAFTNFLETELLDHAFGGNAYTAPATLYLALFTAVTDGEAGTVTEVSGGGYARQTMAMTVTGNEATTSGAVEYPTATANYGTVTHVGIYDALTAGNLMAYASLASSKTIETGDVFRVPAGDLDITLD